LQEDQYDTQYGEVEWKEQFQAIENQNDSLVEG